MIKLIAETAWHHEGDFDFMKNLITEICQSSDADIVKLHITIDFDEYMTKDHPSYELLNNWVFSCDQWLELINIIQNSDKELMLLVNDTKAIEFAINLSPEYIEVHSVCLLVPRIHELILRKSKQNTKIVIGVGGCTMQEIDRAMKIYNKRHCILMFGFQNYPTKYSDINLKKINTIQSLYDDNEFGYADHTSWDNQNNELVTLLVASNSMNYIEKHVTTELGKKRTDFSAAITIDMFNKLKEKANLIDGINGDGSTELNEAEKSYSIYGPNKMAAITTSTLSKGKIFSINDFEFIRTSKLTDLSQLDLLEKIGEKLTKELSKNNIIQSIHFNHQSSIEAKEDTLE